MRHKDVWTGSHKNITYEINKFPSYAGSGHEWNWTYYLFIPLQMVPDELQDKFDLPPKKVGIEGGSSRISYDYMSSVFYDLDWHGGVTWYSKHGVDNPRVIQIGCDYSHLWDEGMGYNEEGVERDAKNTIDMLLEQFPAFKCRCSWNGSYVNREDGVTGRNGQFLSVEGKKSQDAYYEKEANTR